MVNSEKNKILPAIIAVGFFLLAAEIVFYFINLDRLLKDRVFQFQQPDYINYWLTAYIFFAVLIRTFGLVRLAQKNKQGYREYSFGQLMIVALVCKEFFRYSFYVYAKKILEPGNWETLAIFISAFLTLVGILIYFYYTSLKMNEK